MGTIADKLNYLNETKEAIKTSIINKGVEVSDTDTFRSYAEKIDSIEAGGGGWDTSQMTSCRSMFYQNKNMTEAPHFNTENVTDMQYMFSGCSNLENLPNYNTAKVTNMNYFVYGCSKIVEFPALDFSSTTQIDQMCGNCLALQKVPLLYAGKITKVSTYVFSNCSSLVDFGGLKNLGMAYTQKLNNYSAYSFGVNASTKLTHESLMNIINNLYDLNVTYDVTNGGTLYTQTLQLGSTNMAKLTADEIAIATNKGWVVS